jgi:hypothetical protein
LSRRSLLVAVVIGWSYELDYPVTDVVMKVVVVRCCSVHLPPQQQHVPL